MLIFSTSNEAEKINTLRDIRISLCHAGGRPRRAGGGKDLGVLRARSPGHKTGHKTGHMGRLAHSVHDARVGR